MESSRSVRMTPVLSSLRRRSRARRSRKPSLQEYGDDESSSSWMRTLKTRDERAKSLDRFDMSRGNDAEVVENKRTSRIQDDGQEAEEDFSKKTSRHRSKRKTRESDELHDEDEPFEIQPYATFPRELDSNRGLVDPVDKKVVTFDDIISKSDIRHLRKAYCFQEDFMRQKFQDFANFTNGKPHKGLSEKQFYKLYRIAFPLALNPAKLSKSLFKLCCDSQPVTVKRPHRMSFQAFLINLCVDSHRIATVHKYRTLYRIWDYDRKGYLSPGSMVTIVREFYDILGLLHQRDHHRDAMDLFVKMDRYGKCKVFEDDFVFVLMTDGEWVRLAEKSNFCVPPTRTFIGLSNFWNFQS